MFSLLSFVGAGSPRPVTVNVPTELQGGAVKLREGQRAWITYRDAACAVEGYAMRGGSAEPLLVFGCMARLTESRAKDLQEMVDAYR